MIIDYWKLWSQKTGTAITFIPAAWDETLAIMREGKADAHAGLFFSESRDTFLDYGSALIRTDAHIFYDKRLPAPKSNQDFKAYRIGLIQGDIAEKWLNKHLPEASLVPYPDYATVMTALKNGDVRVFAADTLTALHYLEDYGLRQNMAFKSDLPLYRSDWFVAVRQGDTSLLQYINGGMSAITDAASQQIERSWATGKKREDAGGLIIAMDRNYPPLSMIDPDGEPSGLLVEMWQLWSQTTGHKIRFRPSNLAESIEAVRAGKADMQAGLSKSPPQDDWMAYSIPIWRSDTRLYFHAKDHPLSLQDLAGARVGVIKGSFQEQYLREKYPDVMPVLYPDSEELIMALLRQEVRAVMHESAVIEAGLGHLGLPNALKQGPDIVFSKTLHAGVAKTHPELLKTVDDGFKAIDQSQLAKLERRWIAGENRFYRQAPEKLHLTSGEKQFVATHQPLVFSEVDWKPLSIVDNGNAFGGIIADYLSLITQRSGLRFSFQASQTWAEVLQKYAAGQIDIVPALGVDDNVGRDILLTDPFVRFPLVIVTGDKAGYIKETAELNGRKVAVGRGYTSYQFLKNHYPDIELVQVDDVRQGLLQLSNGEVFALAGHQAVVINAMQELGLTNLKIAGETEYVFEHRIGVDPKYPEVVSIINKVLASMTEKDHGDISQHWLHVDYQTGIDYGLLWKSVALVAGVAGLIFFVMMRANRKLKTEVSERKQVEDAMRRIRRELQQIFDSAQVGILVQKADQKVYRCNARVAEILGFEGPRQMVGQTMSDFYQDQAQFEAFIKEIESRLAKGEQVQTEIELKRVDGSRVWCSVSGKTLAADEAEDGIEAVIWVIDDITRRRRMEAELRQSEERVKTILNSISTGILIIDPEKRIITDVNPVAAKMIGLAPDDIMGRECHQFVCPRKRMNCPIVDLGEVVDNAERVLVRADGHEIPVLKTVVPVMLGDKKHLLESFVDLTARKEAEAELQRNLEELERFSQLTVNREERMIELKQEVNELLLKIGKSEKYKIVT